ncbi:phage distal tail protein [Streptomyces sp. NPDC051561]|uniref:phage distal tail protein n=1 Tax=Streptomyces sp. NPDC051561 TaxID=3365658 RepID=UPI0037A5D582
MAAGDQVNAPGHVQLGELLLGRGTPYRWRKLTGWEDLPGLDSGSVPRAGAHGAILGRLLAQSRVITLDGIMIRARPDDIGVVVQQLGDATPVMDDEQPLVVQLDTRGPLLSWVQVTNRAIPVEPSYRVGTITGAALQFTATDPRRYELTERTARTALPAHESGLRFGGGTPTQQLTPSQAAGTGPVTAWRTTGGVTLGTSGGVVTATVTAASPAAPAYVFWNQGEDPAPYPVKPGEVVTFAADGIPKGARVQLTWWGLDGEYMTTSDGAQVLTVAAPEGAAGVTPLIYWAAVPSPATAPLGPSRLLVPGLSTETLVWPLDWGTPGSTGTVTVHNTGNAPAHPVVEFRGPVSLPSITNLATGDVLEYDLDLAEGELLTVDTREGTVLLGGETSRLYAATSRSVPEQSWALWPGAADLAFRSAPGLAHPAASAVIRWRSAYW